MSAAATPPSQSRAGRVIVAHALREAIRRRVLVVVGALTVVFLVLYAVGTHFAFDESSGFEAGGFTVRDQALTGATLLGLAMFAILFLGAVLATFLTMGVVRGDAETGMLQPLVARPSSRATILIARTTGAAVISAGYVLSVFVVCIVITESIGGWSPDRPVAAAALLGTAVVVIAFISLAASVWLTATAQGIAVLMIYGAGLTAGLLGQIGEALESSTLEDVSVLVSWALPFEAIYQEALYSLTADTGGFAQLVIELGPFGGGRGGGAGLLAWSAVYLAGLAALGVWGFRRRDL